MSVAVEVALIYGGDLTLMANGDLLLSQDTPGNPEATFERVLRIIMTNPTTRDANGNPIGRPDDLFHPDFGSGAKAAIGEPYLPATINAIQTRIIQALSTDPYLAATPPPSVTWSQLSINEFEIVVSCTSVTGNPFTLPSFRLTPTGIVIGEAA